MASSLLPRRSLAVPLGVALGLFALGDAVLIAAYALHDGPLHGDFFGIWSFARFEIERPPALIYDYDLQNAYVMALDPALPAPMPFPYPPFYLLLVRPLGWLSYNAAHAAWSATTLLAYLAAVGGRDWRQTTILALLLPATAVNLWFGQNGFLTAALLVGGMRLAPTRPVASGILLGLLAYKPQFGLLVAIALLAARRWRTILAAGITVALMVLASVAAFGIAPWSAWLGYGPSFMAFLQARSAHLLPLMPTALANALLLGLDARMAGLIQAAATILALISVWLAFHRDSGRLPTAVLAVAAVVASPYALIYDLVLVAAALVLIAVERWPALSIVEAIVLSATALLPAAMWFNLVPPAGAIMHLALLGVILRRIRAA